MIHGGCKEQEEITIPAARSDCKELKITDFRVFQATETLIA